MTQYSHPTRQDGPRVARLEMSHGACGGRAELTIVQNLNNLICLVQCYDCGYVDTWSPDPCITVKQSS